MEADSRKLGLALCLVVGVAVVAVVFGLLAVGARATVTGDTPAERIESIKRIADERPWGASSALARAVREEPDLEVRRTALLALGGFIEGDHRALVDESAGDDSGALRGAAARALGRYGDAPAVDRLGKMVMADADPDVRMEALTGLGRCPTPKATALLFRAMETNSNPRVQMRALQVLLRRLQASHSTPPRPGTPEWARLVDFLRQTKTVTQALETLSNQGGEDRK